jgi:phosphoribosylglycinamide formyltransferase-1
MGKKVGILISGRGSNLAALIASCERGDAAAEIVLVLANRPEAAGLRYAEAAGIETRVVDHSEFADRETFEVELTAALEAAGVEIVCLAGFMRLLTPSFVEHWRDRLINIHPSLLPAYPGVKTHERVLTDGVRITGCTVHFVRSEMDMGPIIAQAAVPVLAGDTAASLAARVLAAEHRLYPAALRLLAGGKIRVAGERVLLATRETEGATLYAPALD